MCYVNSTLEHRLVNWVGDDPQDITAHLFCDANFAGCPFTLRSTTGIHADLQGPNTRFAWGAVSTGQTATAQSTPEAELSALNKGMREKAEPAFALLGLLLAEITQQVGN